METLDAIDLRILSQLQGQGRISNLDLSKAVHLSPAQCNRRHRRLEELGLVQRYEARLDAAKLGLDVMAFVHVTMERGHIRQVEKFRDSVRTLEQVQECYAVSGESDYVLKVVAPGLKALSDFLLGTIALLPGVNSVHSSICLDEIKCTSALPLPGVALGC